MPYIKEGVRVFSNFTGCVQNFYLNSSNFIGELRQGNRDDFSSYGALANCPVRREQCFPSRSEVPDFLNS